MSFDFKLPAEAPAALTAMQSLLARSRELAAIDSKLAQQVREAKDTADEARAALDEIEGDFATAEALGEGDEIRRLGRNRDELRKKIAGLDETCGRNERAQRGIALRRDEAEAEIEASWPGFRDLINEIRSAAKSGLRIALWEAVAGKESLIEAIAAAGMLHEVLGVPDRAFLDQCRMPDPLFPVVELATFNGAAGYGHGDEIRATWLLRVKRGRILAGQRLIKGTDLPPRIENGEVAWRDDAGLVAFAEALTPYIAAAREAEKIAARVEDRRERERYAEAERERQIASSRLQSHVGDERFGWPGHVVR